MTVDESLLLLDTPGILWPKFEDPEVGLHLAYTGAVKDDILDTEGLALRLMELLWARYPQALRDRYKLDGLPEDAQGYALLEARAGSGASSWPGGELTPNVWPGCCWRNSELQAGPVYLGNAGGKGMSQVDLWAYERACWEEGAELVCGVDEAGRGPLAGRCVLRRWYCPGI